MLVTKAFSIFAKAEAVYDGRATSRLEIGNYLILCKPDMCISIHGATFVKPLNYQNSGATITFLKKGPEFEEIAADLFDDKPKLIIQSTNKRETLTIAAHEIINHQVYGEWTTARIKLVRSERDLVNQIMSRLYDYFPDIDIILADTEVPTPYGNVDIMLIDATNTRHIIEVKRRVAGVAAAGQINRYGQWCSGMGQHVKKYLAAPSITANAVTYAEAHDIQFVRAVFDSDVVEVIAKSG